MNEKKNIVDAVQFFAIYFVGHFVDAKINNDLEWENRYYHYNFVFIFLVYVSAHSNKSSLHEGKNAHFTWFFFFTNIKPDWYWKSDHKQLVWGFAKKILKIPITKITINCYCSSLLIIHASTIMMLLIEMVNKYQ